MTLIYFILILSITIFIHELGHFIFAKKAGIYVYEFAIGMGPKLYTHKRKNDETEYSIRLIPIGGFVSLAGEQVETDKKIPKSKLLSSKTWMQRFMTMFAGVMFNFIFAIIILFVLGLFYGSMSLKPIIGNVEEDYSAYSVGIETGDQILKMDGKKMNTWDDVLMFFEIKTNGSSIEIEIEKSNGELKTYHVAPTKIITDDIERYVIGVGIGNEIESGLFPAIKYAFSKFVSIIVSMWKTISYLVTGKLALNRISGPVGIYTIVGEQAKAGFDSILYLVAFLSINIGFINLLPIPAFDGGRILFLIIEKIKGKAIKPKTENTIHMIGFILLLGLMILITASDIFKLFIS